MNVKEEFMKLPIVVIAYNRDLTLKRLLNSLDQANYDEDNVDLIISIDKTNNSSVYQIAEKFEWRYGSKIIIKREENLGLRKHVLTCGDLVLKYDGLIMLEDDLVVSPAFYQFATEATLFYNNDSNIAGISLYTYRISEFSNLRTFIPMQDDSDIFYMKVPSSWGQLWTKK